MANFDLKKRKEIIVSGSLKKETLLKAIIKKPTTLFGSVSEFVRSVGIRVFFDIHSHLYMNSSVLRNTKVNIANRVRVIMDTIVDKNAIVKIFPIPEVIINSRVFKNARVDITNNMVIGSKTTLEILDEFLLSELDDMSLDEIEFVEGVYVNVLKYARVNFEFKSSVGIETYKFRYQKLLDHDDVNLGTLDLLTLVEMDELAT